MKSLLLIFCLSLLAFGILPSAKAETVTQTRYLLNTTDSIYSLSGVYRKLWVNPMGILGTSIYKTFTDYDSGLTFYTGVRVYKNNANGTQTQLTSGVSAIASIVYTTEDFESVNADWLCPETNMTVLDNIVIKVYVSINNSTWSIISVNSQWNTESLLSTKLINSTWTFYYYVAYSWDYVETATYWFAMITNNWQLFPDIQPRIENIQLEQLTTNEIEQYEVLAILGLACGVIALGVMVVLKK